MVREWIRSVNSLANVVHKIIGGGYMLMNFNEEEDLKVKFKMRPSEYWKFKALECISHVS